MPAYLMECYQKTYKNLPTIFQLFLDTLDTSLTTRYEYAETLQQFMDFIHLKYPKLSPSSVSINSLEQTDFNEFILLTQVYQLPYSDSTTTPSSFIQKNRKLNILNHLLLFLFKHNIHSEQIILTNNLPNYQIKTKQFLSPKERITFWQAVLHAEPANSHQSAYDKLIRQRNLLIILLALTMGLTAEEIAAIKRSDFSIENYEFFIPRGKGKLQKLPIPHRYREYFDVYWELYRHSASSHLFYCSNGGLLAANKIQDILTEIAFRSGVPQKIDISLLNHTFENMLMTELNNQKAVDWALGKNSEPFLDPSKITLEIKLIDLENL